MAQIRKLKDNGGNVFYPLTHERAVKDSNGVTLETKLTELNSRPYDSENPNGMGYLVLEKDKTFAEQVTKANTIYEIRYEFDLNNATVTIPAGCVLKFNGGTIKNSLGLTLSNNCSMVGKNAGELVDVAVRLRGANIHINHIDSTCSFDSYRSNFDHPTIYGQPNDFSNLIIENCRITANGADGAQESVSGGAITIGADYESGLVVKNIIIRNNIILHRSMGVEVRNHSSGEDSPYGPAPEVIRLKDVVIENNYIKNIYPNTQYGFNISLSGIAQNATVKGNTLIDGRIGVEVTVNFSYVDVIGNKFIITRAREAFVSAASEDKVKGFRFVNNSLVATTDEDGNRYNANVVFRNLQDALITNNYMESNEIRFQIIDNSKFCQNNVIGKAGYTIFEVDGCRNLEISNNRLINVADAYLFKFEEDNGVEPSGNRIFSNVFSNGVRDPYRTTDYSESNYFYDNYNLYTNSWYKRSGPTNARPTVYIPVGYKYFDTDKQMEAVWSGNSAIGDNGWVYQQPVVATPKFKALPYEIPDSRTGGLILVTKQSSGKTSIFIAPYYTASSATEITSNNEVTVSRADAGGNLTVNGSGNILIRYFTGL